MPNETMNTRPNDTALIFAALETRHSATSAQLSKLTGISIRKVSAAVMRLKSAGLVFIVGEEPISPNREVNLYSTVAPMNDSPAVTLVKQTRLSPIGGF